MNIQVHCDAVGVALLVSNDYAGGRNPLPFTHDDADNMQRMFEQFNYTVFRFKNITEQQFISYYRKVADYNYPSKCKRILIYFSGHGRNGKLMMQNEESQVCIEKIIACFRTGRSESKTVPQMAKMFFFDACRGSREDEGEDTANFITKGDEANWMKRIPKEGGMLVAYASTPDHVAYADSSGLGSRWTNCLIQALENSKESDDVCRVLTNANILMREKTESTNSDRKMFQTAEFTCSLTEFVCFKQEIKKK